MSHPTIPSLSCSCAHEVDMDAPPTPIVDLEALLHLAWEHENFTNQEALRVGEHQPLTEEPTPNMLERQIEVFDKVKLDVNKEVEPGSDATKGTEADRVIISFVCIVPPRMGIICQSVCLSCSVYLPQY